MNVGKRTFYILWSCSNRMSQNIWNSYLELFAYLSNSNVQQILQMIFLKVTKGSKAEYCWTDLARSVQWSRSLNWTDLDHFFLTKWTDRDLDHYFSDRMIYFRSLFWDWQMVKWLTQNNIFWLWNWKFSVCDHFHQLWGSDKLLASHASFAIHF